MRPGRTQRVRPGRLRLQLRAATPPGQTKGLVDGAWWPYSDDLITELAPLLAGMAERGHLVHRISYSLSAWQTVPRKVHIAGTLVHACIRSSAESPTFAHRHERSSEPLRTCLQ
jgi:hypothetical protein